MNNNHFTFKYPGTVHSTQLLASKSLNAYDRTVGKPHNQENVVN